MWRWRVLCGRERFGIIDFLATLFRTLFLLCNWHHLFTSIIGAGIDNGVAYSSGARKHWLTNTSLFHVRCTFGKHVSDLCVVCCFNCCPEHRSWQGDVLEMSAFHAVNSHIRCGDGSRTRFRSGESTIIITLVEYTSNPPLLLQNHKVHRRKYKTLEPVPSTSRPVTHFLDEKAKVM